MIIMLALAVLKSTIKNPAKAASMKKELLEIADAIYALFPKDTND